MTLTPDACGRTSNPSLTTKQPHTHTLAASSAFLPDELNQFCARFDLRWRQHAKNDCSHADHTLSFSPTDVHSVLSRVEARKPAGLDGILGCVLRACAGQLAQICSHTVPTCLKTSTVISVSIRWHSTAACMGDFRHVATL